jgi:hypothetical protein
MRLFANYDASGNIRSLTCFNAPQGVSLMLTPAPGNHASEVEGHDLGAQMPGEKTLRDLAKSNTIAAPVTHVKLSKKHK